MTFTEAKNDFDSKYANVTEFTHFLSEHLSYGKVSNTPLSTWNKQFKLKWGIT